MATTWGSLQSSDVSYAATTAGTAVTVTNNITVSQQFTGGGYISYLSFLSYDTTGMANPDELYLPLNVSDSSNPNYTLHIAEYNFGSSLTPSNWLDPTALSALTPIVSYVHTGVTQNILLPLTGLLTFGGQVRLVLYLEEQATASPPVGGGYGYELVSGNGYLICRTYGTDPGAVSSYASEVSADNPDSWWRLNESSGTVAADSSGNGRTGTYINSPVLGVTGLVSGDPDKAVTLSNIDDTYIKGDDDYNGVDFSSTGMSFEAIFTAPDVTDAVRYFPIVGFEGAAEIDVDLNTVDAISGDAFFTLYDSLGLGTIVSGFVFPNTITHVVGTFSSDGFANSARLYVNGDEYRPLWGDLNSSGLPSLADLAIVGGTTNFFGGGDGYVPPGSPPYPDGNTDSMTGTLDEVALYSTQLSRSRVLAHNKAMTSGIPPGPPPTTPTVTYISPTPISTVGGTSVVVVGTGLSSVSSVSFGGTPATSFTEISSTQLRAVAPAHSAGTVDITVTTTYGTSPTSVADQITYQTPFSPPPTTFARWILFDPSDSSTDTVEINPSSGDEAPFDRTIASKSRRAFGNKTNIITNASNKKEFNFSGTILTQAQYDLYATWFNKTNPIEITDDLGRTLTVYITKYEPKRVRKTYVPWFHTYTITGIIL